MPSPVTRQQVDRARARLRRGQARETERVFREALLANRPDLEGTSGRIKTPPPLQRVAERFGGGYRSQQSGEYDWFYGLSRAEQARIRENWMSKDRGAPTPDEVEDWGLPIEGWLALTRGIDAARAVQSGRQLQVMRYGGRHPLHFLRVGDPAEHGTPVRRFTSKRNPKVSHDIDRSAHVQFFTDSNGVVHPIRASYERHRRTPEHRMNAYGQRVARTVPDDDEDPF